MIDIYRISLRQLVILFFIVGMLLLGISFIFRPYHNADLVDQAKLASPIEESDHGWDESSIQYDEIRNDQLTPKYQLVDYGLTFVLLSLVILIIDKTFEVGLINNIGNILIPKRRWRIIALGLLASILTLICYVVDLVIGFSRDEFPPWADSLGIPLFGAILLFPLLVFISLAFSAIGIINYNGSNYIKSAFGRGTRPSLLWHFLLGGPALISLLIVLFTMVLGQFEYMIPHILWFLFFIFLFAGKQRIPKETSNIILTESNSPQLPFPSNPASGKSNPRRTTTFIGFTKPPFQAS